MAISVQSLTFRNLRPGVLRLPGRSLYTNSRKDMTNPSGAFVGQESSSCIISSGSEKSPGDETEGLTLCLANQSFRAEARNPPPLLWLGRGRYLALLGMTLVGRGGGAPGATRGRAAVYSLPPTGKCSRQSSGGRPLAGTTARPGHRCAEARHLVPD